MARAVKVYLPTEERIYLEDLVNANHLSCRILRNVRILLMADRTGGKWNQYEEIATTLQSSLSTVSAVCRQYSEQGIEEIISGKSRRGRVIKINRDIENHLISLILNGPPKEHKRWTLKLLANQLKELGLLESISGASIHKRLKKLRLNLKNISQS